MEVILKLVVLVVDPIAAVLLLYILFSERNRLFAPMGYRFALSFAIAGLFGQMVWSIWFTEVDQFISTTAMPWWIGKDIGYFLFGATYLLCRFRQKSQIGAVLSQDDF